MQTVDKQLKTEYCVVQDAALETSSLARILVVKGPEPDRCDVCYA